MKHMKQIITLAALSAMVGSAGAATIYMDGATGSSTVETFGTGGGVGTPNISATFPGWSVGLGAGDNAVDPVYVESVGFESPMNGRTMQLKTDGGNFSQFAITHSTDGAVDATTAGNYTIQFDYGHRQLVETNWRISLWNTTTDTELDFSTLTMAASGPVGPVLGNANYNLTYDNGAQTAGDGLALRITSTDPDLHPNTWENTGAFDNLSISSVPEPSSTALLGLGGVALILRRRR